MLSQGSEFRFDHVHIYCSDLAASERWFVEGLGAEVMQRTQMGDSTTIFTELGGTRVLLRSQPTVTGQRPAGPPTFGTHHFGLRVDDLDATAAELKRRGVHFTEEPREFRPGVRIAFIKGPDDVVIELLERKD